MRAFYCFLSRSSKFYLRWEDVQIHRDTDLTSALYELSPVNFNPSVVAAYTKHNNTQAAYFTISFF